jgi:hypothetical protein
MSIIRFAIYIIFLLVQNTVSAPLPQADFTASGTILDAMGISGNSYSASNPFSSFNSYGYFG